MNVFGRKLISVFGVVLATMVSAGINAAQSEQCDLKTGQKIFNKCAACHTNDASGSHGAGPNLYGVVGRLSGTAEGFPYSAAFLEAQRQWNVAELDTFLTSPGAAIPGTSMAFSGIRKSHQREAIICFLKREGK